MTTVNLSPLLLACTPQHILHILITHTPTHIAHAPQHILHTLITHTPAHIAHAPQHILHILITHTPAHIAHATCRHNHTSHVLTPCSKRPSIMDLSMALVSSIRCTWGSTFSRANLATGRGITPFETCISILFQLTKTKTKKCFNMAHKLN